MKKVGIYSGTLYFMPEDVHFWDEKSLNLGNIGGSEVWVIQMASQFQKNGYQVYVFADCENEHTAEDGVIYLKSSNFEEYCKTMYFDYFISSRRNNIITNAIKSKHIYLFSQDPFILDAESYGELHTDLIEKIVVQSEYHKDIIKSKYNGLTDEDFAMTFQGLDWDLYKKEETIIKKNKMVWSSHKSRGAKFFIEKVFPLIKQSVPDFEVDFCSYINDFTEDYFNTDGINIIGTASKEQLAQLQKESKIWVYPNLGAFYNGNFIGETFCITAIENGAAGNAIVCANKHGFSTTLNGYNHFVGDECFDDDKLFIEDDDKIAKFAEICAQNAIAILTNDEYRLECASVAYDICQKYTWENAYKTWEKIFNNASVRNNNGTISALVVYPFFDIDMSKFTNNVYGQENAEKNFFIKHIRDAENVGYYINKYGNFDCIVSIGGDTMDHNYESLCKLPYFLRKKWCHFYNLDYNAITNAIIQTFSVNIWRPTPQEVKLFSIFTCTFNTTKEQLTRLYESLRHQTYTNWNWWILDDSTNDDVCEMIKAFNDYRITVIRNYTNHGSIGFNKHTIAMACDGDYLVEVDHDDKLTKDCLEYLLKAFTKYPDCDFVYTPTLEMTNNGPVIYPEGWGVGYGENREIGIEDTTVFTSCSSDINSATIRLIYSEPNHVRCWKKSFYHKIGGHSCDLNVLDDQDLIIRTFLEGKMCKIDKILYVQYEGDGERGNGNTENTQSNRFAEIQRTTWILKEKYDSLIHERVLQLGHKDNIWEEDSGYSIPLKIHDKMLPINYIYKPYEE